MRIDPSEVRLITSEKDAYGWQRLPKAEPLFAKHLSDHSVEAYRRICEGVGRTFEAVVSPHHSGEEARSIGVRELDIPMFGTGYSQLIRHRRPRAMVLSHHESTAWQERSIG